MKVYRLRYLIQILCFLLLIYGGYVGLRFNNFFPSTQCLNNDSYHGSGCYLLPLQRSQYGIRMDPQEERGMLPFPGYTVMWGWAGAYLRLFLSFFVMVLIFNKAWCGWICPFGTLQDGITFTRKKFSVRGTQFSEKTKSNLSILKYVLLLGFLSIYVLLACGVRELDPIYCRICPAKAFLPLFEGNPLNLAVDFTVGLGRFWTSIATAVIAGAVFVGIVFRERFFCILCPVGVLIDKLNKVSFLQLKKKINSCTSCGNCWRVCPMDIKEVYLEKKKDNVTEEGCILCLKCIEACPQNKALFIKFFKKIIFFSSRKYFFKWFKEKNKI
ncbi:MAG: 4Fe-4S binding protein [Candidatus Omnitrophica bacterium]|nr:4Fe-4S binding protein [Candidatus Omnitrophota bacterium]